ncbi:hypothetical protein [Devosia sp.]|uniref:hypothetical protein n=1 Tax=Devosia sp. TaxID=1871048 RepID=UPI0019F9C653|nr:hypothetical protein [Devosia sp.]MBE0581884.1 hypothetical protein [Devosia sp.]
MMRRMAPADIENGVAQVTWTFVKDRLASRPMLLWAIDLTSEDVTERGAIREAFDRSEAKLPEPYRQAWRQMFQFWARPDSASAYDRLLLKKSMVERGALRENVRLIVDAVRPWVKLEPRDRLEAFYGSKSPKTPKSVGDLLWASISSGDALTPQELEMNSIDDVAFLVELGKALDAALFSGLCSARDIDSITDDFDITRVSVRRVYFVDVSEHPPGGGEPDRHANGFAPCAKLLSAVVERLADLDATAARRLVASFAVESWELYRRLWAAAARDTSLASPPEVQSFLKSLSDKEFWVADNYPEIAELRAIRWSSLSDMAKAELEGRIRKGFPRNLLSKRLSKEELSMTSVRRAVAEFRRIELAGSILSSRSASWIEKQVAAMESPVVMSSVTAGFNAGVRIESQPLPSGGDFEAMGRDELLPAIDAALKESDDWDDRSVGASRFLGRHLDIALELIAEAGDRTDLLRRLWKAIGYYSRPADLNAMPDKADQAASETAELAERVLSAIVGIDDSLAYDVIDALAAWMDSWDRMLGKTSSFLPAWRMLWPLAVRAVNATDVEDRPLRERSFSSPVGRLTSALVQALPDLTSDSKLLDAEPWPTILAEVGDAGDEAGLQARFRLVTSISYFYHGSPTWTLATLVQPLRGASGNALELWGAFGEARLPQAEVMQVVGPALALAAANSDLGDDDRRRLSAHVIWSHLLPRVPKPYSASVPVNLTQQMLRMGGDVVRAAAIRALKDFLAAAKTLNMTGGTAFTLVKSIFEQVWPQERTLNSAKVSDALVELPAAAGDAFVDAVAMILPYLTPFDCWSLWEYGVWAHQDDERAIHHVDTPEAAGAFLAMLDRTIGQQDGARVPNGLDRALNHIASKAPGLERDPRYQRLLTLSRR